MKLLISSRKILVRTFATWAFEGIRGRKVTISVLNLVRLHRFQLLKKFFEFVLLSILGLECIIISQGLISVLQNIYETCKIVRIEKISNFKIA